MAKGKKLLEIRRAPDEQLAAKTVQMKYESPDNSLCCAQRRSAFHLRLIANSRRDPNLSG
jgi:hypothetical protein